MTLEIKISTKTYKYAKIFINVNACYYEQFNFASGETRWR